MLRFICDFLFFSIFILLPITLLIYPLLYLTIFTLPRLMVKVFGYYLNEEDESDGD